MTPSMFVPGAPGIGAEGVSDFAVRVPGIPSVSVAPGAGKNTLTITPSAGDLLPVTGYNLYRSTASGTEVFVGTIAP